MPAMKQDVYVMDVPTGTSKWVDHTPGMTAGQLFQSNHPNADIKDYTLAVNNVDVTGEHEVAPRDVVAWTPIKVQGA